MDCVVQSTRTASKSLPGGCLLHRPVCQCLLALYSPFELFVYGRFLHVTKCGTLIIANVLVCLVREDLWNFCTAARVCADLFT